MTEPIRISGDGKVASMIARLPDGFLPEFVPYLDEKGRVRGIYDAQYDPKRNLLTIVSTEKFEVNVPMGGFRVPGKRVFYYEGVHYRILFESEVDVRPDVVETNFR